MKNLIFKTENDFTITADGDAFVSQTVVADLCGVGQDAVSKYIGRTRHTLKLNGSNQLSHESLELVIGHYAFDSQRPNAVAVETYKMLAKGGAKAFIYHAAGYELKAVMPIKFSEALRLAADSQAKKEELEEQLALAGPKVQFAEAVVAQNKSVRMNEYAKMLSDTHTLKISDHKLFAYLREHGYLMKGRNVGEKNRPYQTYIDNSWFEVKQDMTAIGLVNVTFVTGLGQFELAGELLEYFNDY